MVNTGKEQLYGTQFTLEKGELVPRPIADTATVDQRRKEVGLPPLEEYKKQLNEHAKTTSHKH